MQHICTFPVEEISKKGGPVLSVWVVQNGGTVTDLEILWALDSHLASAPRTNVNEAASLSL